MRIRPYVSLPDPGEPDEDDLPPPPPIPRVVTPARQADTPAYGIPAPPPHQPWPADEPGLDDRHAPGHPHAPARSAHPAEPSHPAGRPDPAETVQLRAVPAGTGTHPNAVGSGSGTESGFGFGFGGRGGGGGPETRSRPAARRLLPLLIAAAAVVALGGTAMALWVLPDSQGTDTALMDAKASAPVSSVAPPSPSQSPAPSSSASPSPSASASPSPSPSTSKSSSPSPSASRSSAPPSPSASPSTSRTPTPSPPAAAPTLRYGDSGAEVEKLQRLLAARGLYTSKINGRFDWRVENAVSTFQYQNDIDDEEWGVYGPITRKALEG
ncbi:peptidoglycan-binding domain-containing protein [Streptomyces sp. IBSNAI002]|uniref:peptidoglycan-binding domain-containing protein n=1 Tax=Streptomyces sp. IBSNAI002 TaxID=3457500 RepID=UPI003FCFD994